MRPTKKSIRPPVLPKQLTVARPSSLDGVELEQCRLDTCALSRQAGERVRFDGVHVVGGALSETKLAQLTWLDVVCERCDLSMIDWPRAKLTRVELRGCRVTGARLALAELDDVRLVDCHLDYASFSEARLRQVSFEKCRLKEADFTGADLAGTAFTECAMEGVDLTRAKLHGADVSTSTLGQVRVGAGDVRGLIVNREQAAALSQLFGLVLRDG